MLTSRRHELNHNPEASYRCTQPGCRKSFHRPDLLARHMERQYVSHLQAIWMLMASELEAQMDAQTQWARPSASFDYIPRYTVVPPSPAPYLAMPQSQSHSQPQPQSALSKTTAHHDLAIDGLLWGSMEMSHQPSDHHVLPPRIQESEETQQPRFYSSPETCSSPASDGTTYSVPSGSVSSTSPALVDSYPDPIIDSELTSSPGPMHATLEGWESDATATATATTNANASVVPGPMSTMSIPDSMIHPVSFLSFSLEKSNK